MYVCKFCNTEFLKCQLEEKCICGKLNPNFVSRKKLKVLAILGNEKQMRKIERKHIDMPLYALWLLTT